MGLLKTDSERSGPCLIRKVPVIASRPLCFPCRDTSNNIEHVPLLRGQSNDSWCRKSMKRIKQVSEQLVRPQWKTFVRRFNNSKRQKPQFHYDPRSYALNFDGGVGDEDGGFHHSFFGMFGSSEMRDLDCVRGPSTLQSSR